MMSAQVTPSHGLKFAAPRPNVAMERFAVRCAIGGTGRLVIPYRGKAALSGWLTIRTDATF
jgi:hypothetical protein